MAPVPHPVNNDLGASLLAPEVWLHLRDVLRLSGRELQIVQGIFAEMEQESIAHALNISPDVVYRMTQRIYVKLRIGSRIELKSKLMSESLVFAESRGEHVTLDRAS